MTVPEPEPAGVAHVLSPLKNVVELAVPVADKSLVMVPLVVMVPPVTFTNVPLVVATLVTVPEPEAISTSAMLVIRP